MLDYGICKPNEGGFCGGGGLQKISTSIYLMKMVIDMASSKQEFNLVRRKLSVPNLFVDILLSETTALLMPVLTTKSVMSVIITSSKRI